MDVIRKVSVKDTSRSLYSIKKKVFAIVMDGYAASSIIKSCDEYGIMHLAATNFASTEQAKVNLISL